MSTTDRPGFTLAEYEGLVHWVVRRQWLGGLSYAEALHAGRIAVWRAWQRFDPGRGNAFSGPARAPAAQHRLGLPGPSDPLTHLATN